jgi:hypothetical protein
MCLLGCVLFAANEWRFACSQTHCYKQVLKELNKVVAIPMPACLFASTFPGPTLPAHEVPWNKNRALTQQLFKAELLRWGADPRMLKPAIFASLEQMMRTDCKLFDEYSPSSGPCPTWRAGLPILHRVRATDDPMVTAAHFELWGAVLCCNSDLLEIAAGHQYLLKPKLAKAVMAFVAEKLVAVTVVDATALK